MTDEVWQTLELDRLAAETEAEEVDAALARKATILHEAKVAEEERNSDLEMKPLQDQNLSETKKQAS